MTIRVMVCASPKCSVGAISRGLSRFTPPRAFGVREALGRWNEIPMGMPSCTSPGRNDQACRRPLQIQIMWVLSLITVKSLARQSFALIGHGVVYMF